MSNKPNWLVSLENTVGSPYNGSGNSNTEEEEYKQASSNNTEVPNWLTTFRNRTL